MKITVHTLIKNEENFIWYAINSVIDHVNEILVWDQGSTDGTIEIVRSINNPKIKFRQVRDEVEVLRQKMLKETDADWIIILDGDEVWYEKAIQDLKAKIGNFKNKADVVIIPNNMLVGDIFHYQEEAAGKYKVAGRTGNFNIRAIKKTPGLHLEGVFPNEAYVTANGIKVQNLPEEKILFLDEPYLHASFLKRSSKDKKKVKYEIGNNFPKDFYYPEVFFKVRPETIPSPWQIMNFKYLINAFWQTPLKKLKRRIG